MSTPADYLGGGEDEETPEARRQRYREALNERDREAGTAPLGTGAPLAPLEEPAQPAADAESPQAMRQRYREALNARDAEERQRRGVVQDLASQYTPEQYAEAVKYANEFGVDAKTVADNIEPYRKESKRREVESTLKDAPATREWLQSLDNAAVSQGDVANLTAIERNLSEVSTLTRAGDLGRSLLASPFQLVGSAAQGVGGLYGSLVRTAGNYVDKGLRAVGAKSAADFLAAPVEQPAYLDPERILNWIGGAFEADAKLVAPPVERRTLANEVVDALGQIGGQVTVALAGGPEAALLLLLGQGSDIQGDRAREAGATQQQTDLAVQAGALITAITEKYQLDELLKVVPGSVRGSIIDYIKTRAFGDAAKETLNRLKAAGIGALGEAAQEVTEGIGQNIAAKTIYDPSAAIFDVGQMKQEATVAGYAGGIAKFLIESIVPGRARTNPLLDRDANAELANIMRMGQRFQALQRGEQTAELSAQLVQLVGQTELAQRSPEQLESLAASIKEKSGIEYAYVDAAAFRTLYQSDEEANKAANELTGSGQSYTYYEAAMSGAPIAVPIEKYIARLAPQLGEQKVEGKRFTDFVAFDPDGLTGNEASTQADALFEEAKKAAEAEGIEGSSDTSQAIYDDQVKQLVAAGMEKRTAEFSAMQMRSTFRTLAKRAGMDPLALYQRYQVRVRSRFSAETADGGTELTQGGKRVRLDTLPRDIKEDLFNLHATGVNPDATEREFYRNAVPTREIDITNIQIDKIPDDQIDRYGDPSKLPPILIADGRLIDGQHRIAAARKLGITKLQAIDVTGLVDTNASGFVSELPADPNSDNILFQDDTAEPALPFYSALTRAAENAKIKKGTAEQWMGSLRNVPGVKPEELEWSDLEKWLKSLQRQAYKEEVIGYLRAHELEIGEVQSDGLSTGRAAELASKLEMYAGDFRSGLEQDEDYLTQDEPTVYNDKFTSEGSFVDQDGNSNDLHLEIEVIAVTPSNRSRSWAGTQGGRVMATVTFPDGRTVTGVARFDFQEDGSVGPLEFDNDRGWSQELGAKALTSLTPFELDAAAQAITEVELESNRSLSSQAQRAIDEYEGYLGRAEESLREGEIEDAVKYIKYAQGTAEDYRSDEIWLNEITEELEGSQSKYGTYTTPGGENYKELLLTLPQKGKLSRAYESSHFDTKNIVAHVRFNERTDADGKRVLFLEEIQSDWHQSGRRRGYAGEAAPYKPVDKLPEGWYFQQGADQSMLLFHNEDWQSSRSLPPRGINETDAEYYVAMERRAVQMYNDIHSAEHRQEEQNKPPDAPFKTTWPELAFKRMIRYAADNGFERIAWTPGKLQAERYDLSRQVDEIHVHRTLEGDFEWSARKDDQKRDMASGKANNVNDLADQIGKELADKAAAFVPGERDTFRGDDLKVGGGGMRGFYDRILPTMVNKLVKKWGGKVGQTTLTTLEDWKVKGGSAMDPETIRIGKLRGSLIDVQSVDITPQMREAALGGLPMFQPPTTIETDASGKRGSITWGPDRKFTINLFEKRDLSTYLHESGHLYLEMLGDLAQEANAPQQIKDDYATLLKWFGVKDRGGIGVEQHEQFARGFEAYLAEGKAPSVELQPVFFRFRQWISAVYKAIRNMGNSPGSIGAALNVSLTDEVRAVMDRLVATDEEIAEAGRAQEYAPIFSNADMAGWSEEEWKAYRATADAAHRAEVDTLTSRAMAEMAREGEKWWKAERRKVAVEVTAELNASPIYQAIALLTKGTNADGSALAEGVPTFKLSKADVLTRYGKDVSKRLPRGSMTENPEGISADTAAQLLGFTSGADLVRALTSAPPKKKAIDQLTDARMRERHGDMMIDGTLVDKALETVHSEGRAKVLAAELRALKRKAAEAKPFVDAAERTRTRENRQAREANEAGLPSRDELKIIREAAQLGIANRRIRAINPAVYRRAEAKAARTAFEMAGKGKFEEAYLAKRQQILNFELYRAAVAARATIDKQVDYMRGLAKKSTQERLAKAKGQYREQINALLARFDFTQQPLNEDLKRDALVKWVDAQIAAGREVNIPQWVIDEARTTPYKELTPAELQGLVDAAKNIGHLAKTKDKLLRNRAAAQWEKAKSELLGRAETSSKGGKAPPLSQFEQDSLYKRFGRFLAGFHDSLLRAETIIEWLDGGTTGPWHDFFMEPANNAEYARESLRTKILEPMRKLADEINGKRQDELNEEIRIDSLAQSFDRRTLISIALNMGNASNVERLLEGGFRDPTNRNRIKQFTPKSLMEIRDKLNKADWEFIQQMWNTAESLWPELKAFQERMGGLVPEKIPATPVQTRFGTFTGGYWPVVYDPLASKTGNKQADSADALGILMGANFTKASTNKSALKERTAAGGPLKLDFSAVMGRHLDQVITDITHREFAIQAMRILDDADLSLALQDTIGEVGWRSLRGMVAAAIQQDGGFGDQATREIETMRRRFISNLAVSALGLKVVTAFGNLVLAPIQANARVEAKYLLKGLAKFMRHPIDARAFVDASSEMMRHRAQNIDASFTVIREKIEGRSDWWAKTQRSFMAIHQAADYLGTTGIWLGAYQQALDEGGNHAEAVRLADKAIRTTQTAGAPKDLSAFERNPAYRELKLFIGPMIIMNNRMREAIGRKGVVKRWPEMLGTLLAVWFLPAILWDIVNGRGPDDDDKDDSTLDDFLPWALRKLLTYPMMTIPYLRDAVGLAERKYTGQYAEARMTPASDAILMAIKAGATALEQFSEGDEDDSDDVRKVVKGSLAAAGPLFGIPSGAIDVTGSYIWDVMESDYEPESPADWRYLVMRRPKDE